MLWNRYSKDYFVQLFFFFSPERFEWGTLVLEMSFARACTINSDPRTAAFEDHRKILNRQDLTIVIYSTVDKKTVATVYVLSTWHKTSLN